MSQTHTKKLFKHYILNLSSCTLKLLAYRSSNIVIIQAESQC